MKRVLSLFPMVLIMMIVVTGCSGDDASDEDQHETEEEATGKEESNIPDAATEAEGMLEEGPGKLFTTVELDTETLGQELDSLSDAFDADEAYNYLTHLLAADYESIINEYEEFDPTFTVDGAPTSSDTNEPQEEEAEKKQHVALLMDASGSMGAYVNGEVKMTAAKNALKQFVSGLPEDAQVMLRVYGHEGTGSVADKDMSCSSSEVVYPLDTYDSDDFDKALSEFEPAGWTPLATSIEAAEQDLKEQSGEHVESIVYIISDGEETCGGDPVKAAEKLHESGIATAVNIIGFDVGNEAQQQLKEVAEAGGGEFTNVDSGEDLLDAAENNINEALQQAEKNIWGAMERTDLNWESVHKNKELRTISSDFNDMITHENSLYMDGFDKLQESGKITEEAAEALEKRIQERQNKLSEFNDKQNEELKKRVEEEKEKADDMVEEIREKSSE